MTDQIIKAVEAGIEELYGQSAPQGSVVLPHRHPLYKYVILSSYL